MLSYAPWIATYAADRPLIPTERINRALDHAEGEASGAIAIDLIKGIDLITKPGRDLQSLTWGVGAQVQRHLKQLWEAGYQLGGIHGWAEMQAAVPKKSPITLSFEAPDQPIFEVDQEARSAIAAFLNSSADLIIPLNVEQAIANRVLAIAGNYSKSVLDQLKVHLTAAALGQAIDLKAEIKKTLKVASARAETIARNELTYAYNTARVQVFQQSSLVTHVRFISILDARTTQICSSRNGMIVPMADAMAIAQNRPPLHHRCRSLLSPVMPALNPDHQAWMADPKRQWDGRELEPLADGWRT